MTLAELLESTFRADLRYRGVAYLKAERVSITRVTADHVFGVVRDGVHYQTQLSRQNGELKMYCNCARTQKFGVCKHLWATVLAVEEQGYLTGPPRPGYIPPFVTLSDWPARDEIEWDEDSEIGVLPPPEKKKTPSEETHAGPPLRQWEALLEELRREMQQNELATPTVEREREIFYEIDIAASRSAGQLVIQTSQRQRRANGQWGKLKPLKMRPGHLEEVTNEDDLTILAYLAGGTPERTNWYAQQDVTQSLISRYRLSAELCQRILPLMCNTGRVRFWEAVEHSNTALAWDDGPAWELTLSVELEQESSQWRLVGRLRRDNQTLSTDDTKLLFPGGLVLTKTHIARFQDFGAFEWVSLVERNGPITIPDGQEHEFVDRLLDMPTLPRLELPDELQLDEVSCRPVPQLEVRSPRGKRWHQERLQGQVKFNYLGTLVPGSSTRWAIVQRGEGRCIIRDRAFEEQAWAKLQELGFRRLLDQRRGGHDVEIAARDLGSAVRGLVAEGWQVRADGQQVHQPGELKFRIKSGIDWFDLHAEVDFQGRSVNFPELLSALARGDSTVRLDDGSLGILLEEWAKKYGPLCGLGVADGDHVRFSYNQVALLDALLMSQDSVDYDAKFDELRHKFSSFTGIESVDEPAGFQGELRRYQRDGLGWLEFLQDFQFGGCLADDMGLGKTVQMLALLLDRRQKRKKHIPSLIVVPKSLLFNWRKECARFTPMLQVMEYSGIDREKLRNDFQKYDLVLATYGTLRRDILELKETLFDYVVLDEAQTIKNAGSQVAKAARLLTANFRVAMSGTPVENHLGDLWSIFEFLNPGMLGRSSMFKNFETDADDEQQSRQLLARGLQPFILRRTKAEVASELPKKIEQTIYCEMNEQQQSIYEELRNHYRDSLLGLVEQQGLAKSKMHVLEALLRLRQAACHPGLLDRASQDESCAKLDVLCPQIQELLSEGHKALVFSQFTSMLAIIKRHLDARNIVYEYLDGRTRNREDHIERFQNDPDCGVFLISLKAGGLGLNLTAADYVFLFDPWWNPAVESQAIDRAHRVGQTRRVVAYRLICRGTVEEKISELQDKKRSLADTILTADNRLLKGLSADDLQMLLS